MYQRSVRSMSERPKMDAPLHAARIEDYALIGNCETAALVSSAGSIDWLCLPSFSSPACFAALLGTADHGYWKISPAGEIKETRRGYLDSTMVLETTLRHRNRRGVSHRLHAAGWRKHRPGAPRQRRSRQRGHARRSRAALRLRKNRAVGHAGQLRTPRCRRPGHGRAALARREWRTYLSRGTGPFDAQPIHRQRRRDGLFRTHLLLLP